MIWAKSNNAVVGPPEAEADGYDAVTVSIPSLGVSRKGLIDNELQGQAYEAARRAAVKDACQELQDYLG